MATRNTGAKPRGKSTTAAAVVKPKVRPVAAKPAVKPTAKPAAKPTVKPATQRAQATPAVLPRPDYWDEACGDLVKRDRILRRIIPQHGPVHLVSRGDPFNTLVRTIVGQQISVKAAQSIWERLLKACPRMTPARLLALDPDAVGACGLSRRKVEYLLDLAGHFQNGTVSPRRWAAMDDEAVITEMTQIRGIGRWSAQMFLIFNLQRPNVLPLDDLGLIKAISVNYFSGEPVSRSEAREVAANWEPWSTVATWYLWRSLDPVPVEY